MVASLAASGGTAWRQVGVGLVRIGGTAGRGGLEVVRGGRIAERNVERFQRTGRIDLDVLRGLSADAAPARARAALSPQAASC
jgi:hypothetical protein